MNKAKLLRKLRDREFRRAFADEAVDVGIPVQVREMRKARGWTQATLGRNAGIHQEQVALAEKLNYGRFTLSTLKKLAAAFDCALIVRFAPYSELLTWKERIDATAVNPPSYEGDEGLIDAFSRATVRTENAVMRGDSTAGETWLTVTTASEFEQTESTPTMQTMAILIGVPASDRAN